MRKLLLIIGLLISLCGYSQYYVSNFGNSIVIKNNADTLQVMQKEGLTVRALNPPTVQFVRNNKRIIEFPYTSVTSPVVTSAENFVSVVGAWIASAGSLSLDSIYFSGGDTLFLIAYNNDTIFLNNDTIPIGGSVIYSNEYLTVNGDTVDNLRLDSIYFSGGDSLWAIAYNNDTIFLNNDTIPIGGSVIYSNEYLTVDGDTVNNLKLDTIKNDNGLAITTVAGVNRLTVNSAGNLKGAITTTTIGNANGNIGIGMLNPTIGGQQNYFIGTGVPVALTGTGNIIYSSNGGQLLTSGNGNVILGGSAGQNLTTGSTNVLMGSQAGQMITTGSFNMVFGDRSLNTATASQYTVSIGALALRRNTGSQDVAIGGNAGGNIIGNNNVFIGKNAGNGAVTTAPYTTGIDGNVCIGYYAGNSIATDSKYNIHIGYYAGHNASRSHMLYIDNRLITNPDESFIAGNMEKDTLMINASGATRDEFRSGLGYKSTLSKAVTNNVNDTLFTIPLASGAIAGITATYSIEVSNTDTLQNETGLMLISAVNEGGTLKYSFTTSGSTQPTSMLGTLSKTLLCELASNVLYVSITVNSSIVATTTRIRVTPDVHSSSNITIF